MNEDFGKFIGGLDYNNRQIDLLRELRAAINSNADLINKKQEDSKEAKANLQKEYDWYVKNWNETKERLDKRTNLDFPGLIMVSKQEQKKLMTIEKFKKKVYDKQITTLHYFFFGSLCDHWKQRRENEKEEQKASSKVAKMWEGEKSPPSSEQKI